MSGREFIGKLGQTKFRYLVILLLGASLNVILWLLMKLTIPMENRDAVMIIIGVLTGGFTMGMQHIMKTPDKEKLNGNG